MPLVNEDTNKNIYILMYFFHIWKQSELLLNKAWQ